MKIGRDGDECFGENNVDFVKQRLQFARHTQRMMAILP